MAKKKTVNASTAPVDLYDKLIASTPDLERKGAKMPYTSMNGNMFSFLTPEGALAIRLSDADRDTFLSKYKTQLCEQHGRIMKEYVMVPDRLLRNTKSLLPWFEKSVAYAGTLKAKATTRKPKKKSTPVRKAGRKKTPKK